MTTIALLLPSLINLLHGTNTHRLPLKPRQHKGQQTGLQGPAQLTSARLRALSAEA